MSEKPSEQSFKDYIWHEYNHAQRQVASIVSDPGYLDIGCVDKHTNTKGPWNPPGGGFFLHHVDLLEEWMKHRREVAGVVGVHLYCGFLYAVHNLTTVKEQQQHLHEFHKQFKSLNKTIKSRHRLVIEHDGSAKPFM